MSIDDHRLAARLATEAGERLMGIRRAWTGGDARALGQQGDREANAFLVRELARLRPDDAVLSEEEVDNDRRLSSPRVWIVDPLDGTREFQEPPRTDWAVHVALWLADPPGGGNGAAAVDGAAAVSGGRIGAAAVALPADGVTLSTASPPGPAPARPGPRLLVVSRSRPPAMAVAAAAAIGAQMVTLGSAGAKTMAVVRGQVDAYVHAGGQYEWDSAAPVGVALAAGLHASRVDGTPLVYNQANPYLPDLLVCRPELAEALLTALA